MKLFLSAVMILALIGILVSIVAFGIGMLPLLATIGYVSALLLAGYAAACGIEA